MALAMSSTAIAMQSVEQRSILTMTDTGRATLVTLLVQDLAVIPVLALVPVLAATQHFGQHWRRHLRRRRRGLDKSLQLVDRARLIIGGFIVVILASRYLINPM